MGLACLLAFLVLPAPAPAESPPSSQASPPDSASAASPAPTAAPISLSEALERGDLEAAERELEAICEEWHEQVGANGPADQRLEWARSLHALGVVERTRAKADEAAGHLREALGLYPADSAGAIDASEALALTLQDLGEFDEAESQLRDCLQQRAGGGPHADRAAHANTRDHLALLLLVRGDYEEAGGLLEASLAETPPGDAMARARRHGYLGRYRHTLGSYARALDHADAGLDGLEDLDGLDRSDEVDSTPAAADRPARRELRLTLLSQRALARFRLGRVDAAREDFEQAADEARRHHALGAPALVAIPHLNNLGALELAAGDPAAAVRRFREALGLIEAGTGSNHPGRIPILNNLGSTLLAEGKYGESRRYLLEAAMLQRRHLPPVHLRVAETRRNLALNAMLSGDPRAGDLVDEANEVGLALLERLVRHGSETERLNFLQRIDLVSLSCAGGDAATIADLLIASKSRLLDALLGAEPAATPGWREVRDALPAGAAFIDFCRHHPPDGEARYGAVVIAPGAPPRWVPLGREQTLQTWLGSLQRRLAWKSRALTGDASTSPPPLRCRGILRQLHREFWQPLGEALPESTRDLVVAPDGALHFLPFAVLTDADGHFLCGQIDRLSSVASGRDLLDSSAPAPLDRGSWLALGVTDFSAGELLTPRPAPQARGSTQADPGPLTRALRGLGPMPGTRREVDLLRRLAPANSTFLTGPQASEEALRHAAPAHRLLHLGSHAIFLAPESPPPPFGIDFDLQAERLFASAIVLTGATRRPDGAAIPSTTDDLLFPAEIARLPLGGTRLVTLSSCESGLGTAVAGEGVLGLRRAFHIAGAREVIVSLWPVSDLTTPEFMERFYRLALASDRPGQALWQTQREFLATSRAGLDPEAAILRHAPFVLSQRACPPSSAPIADASPIPLRHWLLPTLPLAVFLLARLSLRVASGRERRAESGKLRAES